MVGEIQFTGIPSNQRIKMSNLSTLLRSKDPSQTLRLFLAGPKRTGNLDQNIGIGEIEGKVSHFRKDQLLECAFSKLIVQIFPFPIGSLAGNERNIKSPPQ